jgi:hypothetical protein
MATEKTDAEKLEIIKNRLTFAKANKDVPYLFKVSSGYSKELTDAKDKQMALGSYYLPAVYNVNYDNGDGKLSKRIIIFKGSDSVTESHEFYKDRNGKFEEPTDAKPIVFEDYQLAVYGDSLPNLNLIEYLSLIEQFNGSVFCQDLSESVKNTQPVGVLLAEDIVNYIGLVDELGKSDTGFEFLKSLAKVPELNDKYQVVDGLAKLENGKAEIISMVKQFIVNSTKTRVFVPLFVPSVENQKLAKNFIEKGLVGYNKSTKAFQLKNGKEFTPDILYAIDSDSEKVQGFMFSREIQTKIELRQKLQAILSELKK